MDSEAHRKGKAQVPSRFCSLLRQVDLFEFLLSVLSLVCFVVFLQVMENGEGSRILYLLLNVV